MRSIGLVATLITSACSLMVSFDDLQFVAGGSGGGTCDGSAGAVQALRDDAEYVSENGNRVRAVATDNVTFLYRAGTSGRPFLVQSRFVGLERMWGLQGDGGGTTTAVAATPEGAAFGGVKSSAAMTLLNDGTNATCTIPAGELFVAATDFDGVGCIAATLGDQSSDGAITGVGALGTRFFAAGHGSGVELGGACGGSAFVGHFIASSASLVPNVCDWAVLPALGDRHKPGVGIQAMTTAADPSWVVVVGGYESASGVAIGDCMLPPTDGIDAFLLRLQGTSGDCVAAMGIPGSGDEFATGVTLSSSSAYIVGRYAGSPAIGDCVFPDTPAGTFAMSLTNGDPPEIAWARGFAATVDVVPGGVAYFAQEEQLRFAGSFSGNVDFGGGTLVNDSLVQRIFAVALEAPTGAHVTSAQVPTGGFLGDDDDVVSSLVSHQGAMVMAGTFVGNTPMFTAEPVVEPRTYLMQASFAPLP